MHIQPLLQHADHTVGEIARDCAVAKADRRLAPRIPRVKVRRVVLSVVDRNDDTEEPTYDRHESILTAVRN